MKANFAQGLAQVEQCQSHFVSWHKQCLKDPDNPALIDQAEKLVILFSQLIKQHPLLALSLLQCSTNKWPWSYRYVFHFALLTNILATCNHWHEKTAETLTRACLLIYRKRIVPLEKWAKGIELDKVDKLKFLSPAHLPETCSTTHPLLNSLLTLPVNSLLLSRKLQQDNGLKTYQSLLMLGSQLALLITPGAKRPAYSMIKTLQRLTSILSPQHYQILNSLLKITGKAIPGSACTSEQQHQIVLSEINDNQIALAQSIDNKTSISTLKASELTIKDFVAPMAVENSAAHLSNLWPPNWQKEKYPHLNKNYRLQPLHYRLDLPPPALTDFRLQLQQNEPDTRVLTRLIESEQHLAKYMCLQAELRSRLNIKVQQVKQALLVQGFKRSFHILSQQALCVRLYQYRFPCFEWLQQLVQWHAALATHLASHLKLNLLDEEVQSVIHFYHAGLFISGTLKHCQKLEFSDNVVFSQEQLFKHIKLDNLAQTSIKLAEYWQQPSITMAAFRVTSNQQKHSSTIVMKLAAIIQLSLAMTHQTLSVGELSKTFFEQSLALELMQQFSLTERDLNSVVNKALTVSSPYLPLQ